MIKQHCGVTQFADVFPTIGSCIYFNISNGLQLMLEDYLCRTAQIICSEAEGYRIEYVASTVHLYSSISSQHLTPT